MMKHDKPSRKPFWIILGSLILILLLLIWLIEAFAIGDTDVNAPMVCLANFSFIT